MIKNLGSYLSAFLFFAHLSACQETSKDSLSRNTSMQEDIHKEGNLTPFLKGKLDQSFIEALNALPEKTEALGINSVGGDSIVALDIAEIVRERQFHVIIDGKWGICASGCAEYILAAASSLKFRNEPLIGFHQNPQIIYHLLENSLPDESIHCDSLKSQISETKVLYSSKNLNSDFWKQTLKKIDLEFFNPTKIGTMCPAANWKFRNELWFPTSVQLKEILGLQFEGEVCADNLETCVPKIDKTWPAGVAFAVGDRTYISKGPKYPN